MKALTLTQPWATLVAIRAKHIETRSWGTRYRGPLAIHAAKGFPKWAREFTLDPVCDEAMNFRPEQTRQWFPAYPVGAVLATCTLIDCVTMFDLFKIQAYAEMLTDREREFGDFSIGRFAWILSDVKCFERPILATGALGLWEWTPCPAE